MSEGSVWLWWVGYNFGSELRVSQKWCGQFGIDTGEFFGQGSVGGSKYGEGVSIMGGCSREIGNCFDGVLLVDIIIGLVAGGTSSSGASSITEF